MANDPDESGEPPEERIHPLPITGELDLHTFRPQDLGGLLPEYLAECRAHGILEVRVVHGKGRGEVARSVRALLGRIPGVISFGPASGWYGGEGATFVRLLPWPATGAERSSGDGGTSRAGPPDPDR